MTAISLAVAAIPEGLLAIVTIVAGHRRTADDRAERHHPPPAAVEALGSATVICSDKNRHPDHEPHDGHGPVRTLCGRGCREKFSSRASYERHGAVQRRCTRPKNEQGETVLAGDPTETALLACANRWGFDSPAAQTATPRVDELPFDSDVKRMATVHRLAQDRYVIYVKGGLTRCSPCAPISGKAKPCVPLRKRTKAGFRLRRRICHPTPCGCWPLPQAKQSALAAPGDRVPLHESGLTFLGMAGMIDPPRPTAREAGSLRRRAGIKPVMITGDHRAPTASAIARDLGILEKQDRARTGQDLGPHGR